MTSKSKPTQVKDEFTILFESFFHDNNYVRNNVKKIERK